MGGGKDEKFMEEGREGERDGASQKEREEGEGCYGPDK